MHFYLFPKRVFVFVPPPSLEDGIVGKKLVYGMGEWHYHNMLLLKIDFNLDRVRVTVLNSGEVKGLVMEPYTEIWLYLPHKGLVRYKSRFSPQGRR